MLLAEQMFSIDYSLLLKNACFLFTVLGFSRSLSFVSSVRLRQSAPAFMDEGGEPKSVYFPHYTKKKTKSMGKL